MTAIAIKKITKQFPRTRACDDISFEVPKGGIYGLLGPNGAGKTTLFSIVAGFLRATSGDVHVLGCDTRRISELRGRLTILPQDAKFAANMPVIEQIVFFSQLNGRNRAEAEKDAADALAKVGLSDSAAASANTLSHGMYKRVGIAQAFLGKPEVILLDEPTAGLDPASAQSIRDLIQELHQSGVTLVVSSHNLAEIQKMCEAVAILDKGKLVTWSKVKDLTQADKMQRMTFARDLTDAERAAIASVEGVRGVEQDGPGSYRIAMDASSRSLEQMSAEIVGKLVTTGAVPRSVEDGVALETKYLEMTAGKAKD
ncbi:MAG TPA: ABC transporter ATP-binding protein [Kofleriaceae bacterium]|nr:ABC transporter ATP-binding protein [Kofleriaceae bacterium]